VVGGFDLFWVYFKTSWELASDRRLRPAFVIIGLLLAIGTIFYKIVEHWTWLDALYFSVIALSTVGFGDVTPETRLGKLFTIFYIVVGIGIFFVVINSIARIAAERMHMSLLPPVGADQAPQTLGNSVSTATPSTELDDRATGSENMKPKGNG
jgi:voltage-gated potassium channel